MQFEKISILLPRKVFRFAPPLTRKSSLAACINFASKILSSKSPSPLGISDDLSWGGYGFFLELFILISLNLIRQVESVKMVFCFMKNT